MTVQCRSSARPRLGAGPRQEDSSTTTTSAALRRRVSSPVPSEQPREPAPTRRRQHHRSRSSLNRKLADRTPEATAFGDHKLDHVTNPELRFGGRDLLLGDLVHVAVVQPGGAAADRAAAVVDLVRCDRNDDQPSATRFRQDSRVLERRESARRVLVANEDLLDPGRGGLGERA